MKNSKRVLAIIFAACVLALSSCNGDQDAAPVAPPTAEENGGHENPPPVMTDGATPEDVPAEPSGSTAPTIASDTPETTPASPPIPPPPAEPQNFEITAFYPSDNATNIALNSPVWIQFNQPLSEETVTTEKFSIERSSGTKLAGSIEYDSQNKALILFTRKWQCSQTYTVKASKTLTSSGGVALPNDKSWKFSTPKCPLNFIVTDTFPRNGDTNVVPKQVVEISFSGAIYPSSFNGGGIKVSANGTDVTSKFAWVHESNFHSISTLQDLEPSTTYSIEITNIVKSLGSTPLGNPQTVTFSTAAATDAIHIKSTSPRPWDLKAPPKLPIRIYFNKPIDENRVNDNLIHVKYEDFIGNKLAPVEGKVFYNKGSFELSFVPDTSLPQNRRIVVTMTDALADLNGNPIPAYTWEFKTGDHLPGLLNAEFRTDFSSDFHRSGFGLTFENPTTIATNAGSFRIKQLYGNVKKSTDGKTILYLPLNGANYDTPYTILLNNVESFFKWQVRSPVGLQVIKANPASGASDVPVNSSFAISFNYILNQATIEETPHEQFEPYHFISKDKSSYVLGSAKYDIETRTLTLTPVTKLDSNKDYELILRKGSFSSLDGLPLPEVITYFKHGLWSVENFPMLEDTVINFKTAP